MLYRCENSQEWSLQILQNETNIIRLESVGLEISLQQIYEGIES
jgi:Uma2 family endonuclease